MLRVKGLGVSNAVGLSSMPALREVTLTMAEALSAAAWQDLGTLTGLANLNINAWTNSAPTDDGALLQRMQTLEGLPLAVTNLRSLGRCTDPNIWLSLQLVMG